MLEFHGTLANFKSITDERLRAMAAEGCDVDQLRELKQRLDHLFAELQHINATLFEVGI